MDSMLRAPGHEEMTYDDLMGYLINTGEYWWAARIYKNYNGLLDMYIQWASDSRVHHYVLDFDPLFVRIGSDYDGWPAPRDFYLARTALCTGTAWTIDEYNNFFDDPPRVPILPPIDDEPPIADEARPDTLEYAQVDAATMATDTLEEAQVDAATMATTIVEEGGSVFMCAYFFHFSPARFPLFHFLFFDYFFFWSSFVFLSCSIKPKKQKLISQQQKTNTFYQNKNTLYRTKITKTHFVEQ